jgi:hypothetical protein
MLDSLMYRLRLNLWNYVLVKSKNFH